MSEEIVACPGCDKKFRIPEGAPAGAFDCTACGAEVAYGADAAGGGGGGGGRRSRGRAKGKGKGKGKGAGRARASRGKKREARARRRDAEDGAQSVEEKRKHKSANTWGIVAVVMGVLAVLVLIILAVRPKEPVKPVAKQGTGDTYSTGSLSSEGGDDTTQPEDDTGAPAAGTEGTGGAAVQAPSGTDEPDDDDDDDDDTGGIGSTGDGRLNSSTVWHMTEEELFVSYPPLEGTSEEEAAAIQQDVAFLLDRDSGIDGTRAQMRLEKRGKASIPALLSTWEGKGFDNEDEQLAADMVQRVLRSIARDDGPSSDFHARFVPHEPIDPPKFKRAGRMWIAWWLSEGKYAEKYTYRGAEDEE